MRNYRFILLVTLFVASMGSPTSVSSSEAESLDDVYKEKIIGYWAEGTKPYGIAAFLPNGVYEARGYTSEKKEKLVVEIRGKWWVENNKLFNQVTELRPPNPKLKPGRIIVDDIVSITESELTLIDSRGKKYTKTRVTNKGK